MIARKTQKIIYNIVIICLLIVYETLKELGALGKKTITLFNKQDRVSGESLRDLRADHTLKISEIGRASCRERV